MYLLTPDVRASWAKFATGDRSPSIPIGQIESFGLPENLIAPKKAKQSASQRSSTSPPCGTDLILAEFQTRQKQLMKLHEIQTSLNAGLDQVWGAAWMKLTNNEK